MSYEVQYINCKICGSDMPKILGLRGNLEYSGAFMLESQEEHIVTNVVRCRKCGFVYTNPLILSNPKKMYDNAQEYKPSADGIDPKLLFNISLGLIEKYSVKGKLLDIGCGKGEFLALAKERGWQAYGVEPSGSFANYAFEKYNSDIKRNILEYADFGDSFFDAVTMNMVLEHLDNPKATIAQVNKLLKKGGILFIEVPNMDSLMLKFASIYFRLKKKEWSPFLSPLHYPYHCYGYNVSSLRYLLESFNFEIKKVLVTSITLRGMRHRSSVGLFERMSCRLLSEFCGFLGKGDILTVIATKKKEVNP